MMEQLDAVRRFFIRDDDPNDNEMLGDVNTKLTTKQAMILPLLIAGVSVREAAERVGVNRSTVFRWMNKHAEFQAVLNRERKTTFDEWHFRVLASAGRALQSVCDRADAGEWRAQMVLLKGIGVFKKTHMDLGPLTQEGMQLCMEQEEYTLDNRRNINRLFAGMAAGVGY